MKKKILRLSILAVLFFLMFSILSIKFYNGFIPNIQTYSNLQFIPTLFWLFLITIFTIIIAGDNGFMKIGAVFGIATGIIVIIFLIVNNSSSFELITSDKYELIVETENIPGITNINVYEKDGLFFSKFVDNAKIQDIYELSYEIVGDSFVITMCSINSCITLDIDLE